MKSEKLTMKNGKVERKKVRSGLIGKIIRGHYFDGDGKAVGFNSAKVIAVISFKNESKCMVEVHGKIKAIKLDTIKEVKEVQND